MAGLLAVVLVAGSALAGCSGAAQEPAESPAAPPTEIDNTIGEDGVSLDVEGVTIDFPPGAATGAEPLAETLDASAAPQEVDVSADSADSVSDGPEGDASPAAPGPALPVVPLADGVSVSLDNGQTQPASPVRVTFRLPASSLPTADELAAAQAGTLTPELGKPTQSPSEPPTEPLTEPTESASDDPSGEPPMEEDGDLSLGAAVAAGNVAFLVESDDGTVELVPATFDETTGTVSGDVPHFSGIWPVSFDIGAMVDSVLQTVGATSPQPSCADQPATVGEERYTVVSDPLMWMCVHATDDGAGLVVEATANAAFPFYAEPDVTPDTGASSTELTAAAVATAWAADYFQMVPEGKAAVFPSGATRLTYAQAPGDLLIDFDPAPELLLVSILAEVGSTAFSMTPAELADTFGNLECMAGVGELINEAADGELTPADGAELLGAFFSCAGTVAGKLTEEQEIVVALFSAAPQLLIGSLWGLFTTFAGASSFTVPVRVSRAGDPISAADLEPFVGTWSGPVVQKNPDSNYSIEVTISATSDGFAAARVRYPELDNCMGYWDEARLTGRTLRMVEHIDPPTGSCVESVDVVVRRVGEQLSYKSVWFGDAVARGMLTRGAFEGPEDGGQGGAASWPTGKDEAPAALMAWLGANMYDFPDWVACDDAQDWCLVDQPSGPMLVEMDGLMNMGTIANDAASPLDAIVGLGAPRAAAMQMLI